MIEFKNPPNAGNRKWVAIVNEIKARPGEWAFVGNMTVSAGYKQARQHNLEIRVANRDGSKGDIYLKTKNEEN